METEKDLFQELLDSKKAKINKGDKTVTLKLSQKYQDKFEGEEFELLTFQRLKGKHLRKIGVNPDMGQMIDIASRLCGKNESILDEMEAGDVMNCIQVVNYFLGNGQKTG